MIPELGHFALILAALVALVPLPVVTLTSTVPALPAGALTVMDVALLTVNVVRVAPNWTLVTPEKFVPVMVTLVPPAVGPLLGEMLLTVGTGR